MDVGRVAELKGNEQEEHQRKFRPTVSRAAFPARCGAPHILMVNRSLYLKQRVIPKVFIVLM